MVLIKYKQELSYIFNKVANKQLNFKREETIMWLITGLYRGICAALVMHIRGMCGSMGLVPAMFAWAMTYGAYMWTQTGIFW